MNGNDSRTRKNIKKGFRCKTVASLLAVYLDRVEALHRTGHQTQPHTLAVHLHDAHLLTKTHTHAQIRRIAEGGAGVGDGVQARRTLTLRKVVTRSVGGGNRGHS